MLTLDRVRKSFGDREVVRETSLSVGAGERLALIGPSGSGKSTLLKMVLGLVTPDAGTVKVGDVTVTPETARAVRRRIGYVVQDGGLFPHLTAADNVALVARLEGKDEAFIRSRTTELCAIARIDEALLARYPQELSGGERQRVGLVRALVLDPPVLLLDEPLSALDPLVRARLQDDLAAAFRSLEKCVLLVTHDMAEAATLADRIAVLRDGKLLQVGPMRELADAPADPFVTELLGAQRSLAEALR